MEPKTLTAKPEAKSHVASPAFLPAAVAKSGHGAPAGLPIFVQRSVPFFAGGNCSHLTSREITGAEFEPTPAPDVGYHVLQQLLQSGVVRTKLKVGGTDDPAEHDADRMAEAAVQRESNCACSQGAPSCPNCQASQGVVQRKPSSPGMPAGADSLSIGASRPLGQEQLSFFESRYNADLSGVRLHDNEQAASSAAQLNARAFTLGSDIVFGRDQYSTHTAEGQLLLAHELAHVLQQDRSASAPTIRRVGATDPAFGSLPGERQMLIRAAQEDAARERHHKGWVGSVDRNFGKDLANQSRTIGEERGHIDLALTFQRAAAIDAVASGKGWLNEALRAQGYSGLALSEIKQSWGEALVAAEALKFETATGDATTGTQLFGLQSVPTFYGAIGAFSRAAEEAHQAHAKTKNDALSAKYQAQLAEHERSRQIDKQTMQGWGGELGSRSASASLAGARELVRPDPPTYLIPPPVISDQIEAASARIYNAETYADWAAVANDVNRIGNGFVRLVVASLDEGSNERTGVDYLEQLDIRLAELERTDSRVVRIPAVFYPNDRTINQQGKEGEVLLAPEAIPWQFYLVGVTNYDHPAYPTAKWVLIDLTSNQRFENQKSADLFDMVQFQEGKSVDPPTALFSGLDSRTRFPKGQLYLTLPSSAIHPLETTEPKSIGDWLRDIGLALAAIALSAAALATGGLAGAGAVALWAGIGATAAGIGSTLANLYQKSEQGIVTSGDVEDAMIQIGLDLLSMASMGLGKLSAVPRVAARLGITGERLVTLRKVTQLARVGALGGDLYQAWSFTSEFIAALKAIDKMPGDEEEHKRMKGQLVRRGLLAATLLTVAIRSDVQDMRPGDTLRITDIDDEGALLAVHPETDAPHQHVDAPGAHALPHADVTGPVHANAEHAGAGITVGRQSHAVAAAGTGPGRDFYFCSDRCAPIVHRLEAIVDVLPRNHPEREIFEELLNRARKGSLKLKRGKIKQEEADAMAHEIASDISRHSDESELFSALMNTDPALLATHRSAIRQHLRQDLDLQTTHLGTQSERQVASRGKSRGGEPTEEPDARSAVETDVLGGFDIQEVAKAGWKKQPLKFDAGIFAHTNAEALARGLPRGLSKEVTVNLPGGKVGRADRVYFVRDKDGKRIGARVYEIKPNTPGQIAKGEKQVEEYVAGLRAEIEGEWRDRGRPIPTEAEDGLPLYSGQVVTYERQEMRAVLRAIRGSRRDAARLAEDEAIVKRVFDAAR